MGKAPEEVVVVIGPGSIGQAIARRVGVGRHVLLADMHEANATTAAKVLHDAGYVTSTAVVDVASRASVEALVARAVSLGRVTGVVHAAGVSPSQAPRTPSWPWTCTERRWCWRRSATSSRKAGQPW